MPRRTSHVTVLLVVASAALSASWPAFGQIPAAAPRRVDVSAPAARVVDVANDARTGRVRGTTTDASDGVLPGVSVVATTVDGRPLASATTDARGEFVFGGLAAGPVVLSFSLDGFAPARATVHVEADGPGRPAGERMVQQLELLALTERVTVRADPPPPPPPPKPSIVPLPEHDQASVCGPAKADAPVPAFGTVRSRDDDESKVLFATGDALLIDGGRATGLDVGQNFVVRRRFPTALRYGRNRSLVVMGEHSSGLLQIVAVEDDVATAVVVYACDEIMRGDYLASFEPEPLRTPDPAAPPIYEDAARLLFADVGQPLGVTGRMMILDRGARHDVRVGQRLTLFRRSRFGDGRPLVVGEAVVVAVRGESSTIRVERATDAIYFGENGDWAAPQRAGTRAAR